mgnify:CR=1 FL=1
MFFLASAFLGVITGFVGGMTEADLRLANYGSAYLYILAVPVTFWALFTALNGHYRHFEIIVRDKTIAGD